MPDEATKAAMLDGADERAVRNGCRFDPAAADRVERFFSRVLTHSKGQFAGEAFELQAWQSSFLRRLFGWKRADGTRRYRTAYLEVPKKNGKSTICSGLSLYGLVGDGEPGAEVYNAAADRNQASIVFGEAVNMAEASPILAPRLEVVKSTKRMIYPAQRGFMHAMSAEAFTKEGINAHFIIFDELHAQPNRILWDTLRFAGAARRQPLTVAITTAGYDRNSICWEQHEYAEKVNAGIIEDDAFLGVVYAASPEDDWTSPETWRKANPSLGVTMSEDSFAEGCREAQNSPAKENAFKRYRLNIWTEQADRWLQMARWDALHAGDPLPWEAAAATLAGRTVFGALDLSSTADVTAFAMVSPPAEEGGEWIVVPWFWIPRTNALAREKRDRVPYREWSKAGYLTMTEGDVIDQDRIVADVLRLAEAHGVAEVAIDRWNADNVERRLLDEGLPVVRFGQGFGSMSAPSKAFEALVLSGRLRHHGNPVLRWMASNVAAETDAAGNVKPSKKASTEKIDGIVAAVMGIGRALVAESEPENPYAAGVRDPWGAIA